MEYELEMPQILVEIWCKDVRSNENLSVNIFKLLLGINCRNLLIYEIWILFYVRCIITLQGGTDGSAPMEVSGIWEVYFTKVYWKLAGNSKFCLRILVLPGINIIIRSLRTALRVTWSLLHLFTMCLFSK